MMTLTAPAKQETRDLDAFLKTLTRQELEVAIFYLTGWNKSNAAETLRVLKAWKINLWVNEPLESKRK